MERAGTKLRFLLWTSDPWSKSKCQSIKCLICTNPFNSSFSCRKRNVSYKTYCLRCAEEAGADEKTLKSNVNNSIKFYFGETFRDAYTRGAEHLSDYVGQTDDSHMFKHLTDSHPGSSPRDVKFGMSVVRKHKSSFERQIFENVLIFRDGNNVLNSKSEFNRCQIPRLSVMCGDQSNVAHSSIEESDFKKDREWTWSLTKRGKDCLDIQPTKKRKHYHFDHFDKVEASQRLNDKAKSVPDPNDDENVKYSSFPIKTTKPEVPKPTKTIAKVKGQTKLFQFFSQTTTNGKKVLQNSPAPPPT